MENVTNSGNENIKNTKKSSKSYGFNKLNKMNTIFLLSSPIIAIAGVALWLKVDGFNMNIIWLSIAFYFLTGLGITAGYHRLFAHRAYKASALYRGLMLILGGAALQNSALKWCNDHRVHHTKVDTDHDPYNINEGFFYAHMGWILLQENIDDYRYSKDLLNDKLVMLQHKYYLPLIVLTSFLLPGLLGYLLADSFLGGFFVAGFARAVFVHHCTFFINSLCHMLGTRPYDKEQTARDSWIMALFTFGEGYHNYHHTFQADYRNGIKWYHYDPTKWLIWTASKFGITTNLKKVQNEEIMAKMIEANLNVASHSKYHEFNQHLVQNIKEKLDQIYSNIQKIKGQGENAKFLYNENIEKLQILLKQSRALVS